MSAQSEGLFKISSDSLLVRGWVDKEKNGDTTVMIQLCMYSASQWSDRESASASVVRLIGSFKSHEWCCGLDSQTIVREAMTREEFERMVDDEWSTGGWHGGWQKVQPIIVLEGPSPASDQAHPISQNRLSFFIPLLAFYQAIEWLGYEGLNLSVVTYALLRDKIKYLIIKIRNAIRKVTGDI